MQTNEHIEHIDFDELLTTDEAADLLRVSASYIRLRHNRGIGPDAIRIGRLIRYRICDLEAWLLNAKVAA